MISVIEELTLPSKYVHKHSSDSNTYDQICIAGGCKYTGHQTNSSENCYEKKSFKSVQYNILN